MGDNDTQFVYVTGHNAAGKTTLGKNAVKELPRGWECIDGDEFVNRELGEMMVEISKSGVMELMRGEVNLANRTEEERYEKIKQHDGGVRERWEPFFRRLFESLKKFIEENKMSKVIFPYHCFRLWTIDLIYEYFGEEWRCTIIEVTTEPRLRYKRWVERQVVKGLDPAATWRDNDGVVMRTLRERYGPEYEGNEEHFLKFVEQRYFAPREAMPRGEEGKLKNVLFLKNDNFEGLAEMVEILGRS